MLPPRPYADPNPPPQTSMGIAKSLAAPGVVFLVAGLVLLAVGVTVVVPVILLVLGVGDLVAAAFYALKDPYVRPTRDDDA